jgi:hypothetical protein
MAIVGRAPAYFSMAEQLTPSDKKPAKKAFDLAARQLSKLVRFDFVSVRSARGI